MAQPAVTDIQPLERSDALSISALYDEVGQALAKAFPPRRALWVRGEIQSISDRTGHCYMDLVDPDGEGGKQAPVLKVKCWQRGWDQIKRSLAVEGLALEPGMVVLLRGTLDFYKPKAEVGFILAEVDVTALLGRLAAQRAALLRALQTEGLLDANRLLPVPPLPLRVGLVASPGTEGERDFLGQLTGSGFAFHVHKVAATVQGPEAPISVATALMTLGSARCDIVALVRGGGSKGDLGAFDTEPVARAIAAMPVPVWTGIGHTGDQSVADLVANQSFITPTECGQELVGRVSASWGIVADVSELVIRRATQLLGEAEDRDSKARYRLAAAARNQLSRHADRLSTCTDRLATTVPLQLEAAMDRLRHNADRLAVLATVQMGRAGERLAAWRRLMVAYDVDRQLERGYTLTLDSEGRIVRGAGSLTSGIEMITRFADGTAWSTVSNVEMSTVARAEEGQ